MLKLNVVLSIQNETIIICAYDKESQRLLKKIGCRKQIFKRGVWILSYSGQCELLGYLLMLRNEGFMFSGGEAWSPSAIFQKYREDGLVDGPFDEVAWDGLGDEVIRTI